MSIDLMRAVRVRTAEDRPLEHSAQMDVCPILGPAGHLVRAVVPNRPRADHLVGSSIAAAR